jgi:hypothetical protein
MSHPITLCPIHGARCGHLNCVCRRANCPDCTHYGRYSGVEPMRLILEASFSRLKVNRVAEPAPPAATGLLPERP